MYLLDTNILSALVRNPQAQPVVSHITRVGDDNISTSVIVAAELRFGAAKKGSASLAERVDRILAAMPIIDFAENMAHAYAEIRVDLEAKGQKIGGNDLLIAAQALTLGAVLVTDNEREFRRVDGLTVENWLTLPSIETNRQDEPFIAEYDGLSASEQEETASLVFNALRESSAPGESITVVFGACLDRLTDRRRKITPVSAAFTRFYELIGFFDMVAQHDTEFSSRLAALREAPSPAALIEALRQLRRR